MISAQIGYCPITILPTSLDKLFEKLLGRQFTEYMDPKLGNSLTAYRKNDGCDTTLLGLVEKWKMDLDNKQVVGVLSSDMNKAHHYLLRNWNHTIFQQLPFTWSPTQPFLGSSQAAWETTLHLLRSQTRSSWVLSLVSSSLGRRYLLLLNKGPNPSIVVRTKGVAKIAEVSRRDPERTHAHKSHKYIQVQSYTVIMLIRSRDTPYPLYVFLN